MKKFSDLNITPEPNAFLGDKIKVSKVLNQEITVLDYRIRDSKYENGNGKCLQLALMFKKEQYVLFSGSATLMKMLDKINKEDMPFTTSIVKDNDRLIFT